MGYVFQNFRVTHLLTLAKEQSLKRKIEKHEKRKYLIRKTYKMLKRKSELYGAFHTKIHLYMFSGKFDRTTLSCLLSLHWVIM